MPNRWPEADEIVIGAPYWDLSFPAALKTYLEHCCVCDVTFHYTQEGRPEAYANQNINLHNH